MDPITISAEVHAPLAQVWHAYTDPQHIMQWNQANDDWHCPAASNDLRVGGKMVATMAAKDGSFQFDFEAIYDEIIPQALLHYHLSDGRQVHITFDAQDSHVLVTTVFDPESENPIDMQRDGWQAILNSFKQHTESL